MNERIKEAAAGAKEQGFSAETRAEWARALKEDEAELARVEARIKELEPQGKIDQAQRRARDIEEATARKARKQKLKM